LRPAGSGTGATRAGSAGGATWADLGSGTGATRAGSAGGDTWADLGSGTGAFTLALAELLGPGARIVSIDRDAGTMRSQAHEVRRRFPGIELDARVAEFERPLDLPLLDGLVAANSLHSVDPARQFEVERRLAEHLRPGGGFVVVEYDADRGNPWVPHPFSSPRWLEIATAAGLDGAREIGRVPSRFLGAICSAVAERP
jgi:SAM-dependent methyltransferase